VSASVVTRKLIVAEPVAYAYQYPVKICRSVPGPDPDASNPLILRMPGLFAFVADRNPSGPASTPL